MQYSISVNTKGATRKPNPAYPTVEILLRLSLVTGLSGVQTPGNKGKRTIVFNVLRCLEARGFYVTF